MTQPNYTIIDSSTSASTTDDWCCATLEGQGDIACWLRLGHSGDHETVCLNPCQWCGGLNNHRLDCSRTIEIYIQWSADGPA